MQMNMHEMNVFETAVAPLNCWFSHISILSLRFTRFHYDLIFTKREKS